ncbi:Trehalase [Sedimentisphaera cyanobacteriorum]|uniref:Trehalase n=1 Tax=Sedimentisphaera cyanobacteriorum TaxID=1940790 RepID=A0A1Q2HP88_9BACT|nr:glycoside hydrolase family 15 protein [Sedimentisphaera cyanobacteriorum]AQQ09267.1 Trehalase [Sedimentisphaera cyanobacteriorum]
MQNLDYGIIGNCKSAALVSKQGSIDWCCLPDFDSPSVFAKILDKNIGGSFSLEAADNYQITQKYIDKTNVLATEFSNGEDAFCVYDFMPRYKTEAGFYHCPPEVVRFIRHIKGEPEVMIKCDPRPAYAKDGTVVSKNGEYIKYSTKKGAYESVYLYTDFSFDDVIASKPVKITTNHFLLLGYNQKLFRPDLDWIELEYQRTRVYWMGWVSKTKVYTNYQKEVERSSLVLKLLAYQKTGAILAAATTSLPETIGEVRNWDYRYCWLRDASMTISILTRLGHYNVARRFLRFLLDIIPYKNEKIQIMYPINHRGVLKEKELPWLDGYENSKPVRIGNAAARQKQNDIYGIVLDAIWESLVFFHDSIDNKEDLWTVTRTLARHIKNNWQKLDSGIWEFRTEQKHFTFSKLLCWVGMDRAARIANFFGKSEEANSYIKLREVIKKDILKKGRDPRTNTLTQYYGSQSIDAANLLANEYGFLQASDPTYVNTVLETHKDLCRDGLMYRYKTSDDFGTPKSSFTTCTFWMIKCLFFIGRRKEATENFERVLSYGNHLGLFSEDIDFESKRLLGNFPQGYSHISLIDTALTISESPYWLKNADDFKP